MKTHFTGLTSPLLAICGGYIYSTVLVIGLYEMEFYKNSTFFSWGTPVKLLDTTISDNTVYYCTLGLFFVHQLINKWIRNVTYPWVINCIQDPKATILGYSRGVSMLIVNMFSLYSKLDFLIIIAGVMSQITFFIAILLANLISISIINWQYIKKKSGKVRKFYDPINKNKSEDQFI